MSVDRMTLDDLAAEDPVIRAIARAMRDGQGMSLDKAVAEISELVPDPTRVAEAADRIRILAAEIQSAQAPRAVVAGNIESWYPGPRAEDRSWTSLVEALDGEGWSPEEFDDLDKSSTKVVA